jgi:hypothetical protein
MIKVFCDLCGKEIECATLVNVHGITITAINQVGINEGDYIFKTLKQVHKECKDELVTAIHKTISMLTQ